MFWSKLCKSTWNCAWNLAFPVFISPIVWNTCENLHYESVYFKELHNDQAYYWPTIYRAGTAVVSTIIYLRVYIRVVTSLKINPCLTLLLKNYYLKCNCRPQEENIVYVIVYFIYYYLFIYTRKNISEK